MNRAPCFSLASDALLCTACAGEIDSGGQDHNSWDDSPDASKALDGSGAKDAGEDGADTANVSEDLVKRIADAMVATGMKDAGCRYVNTDDCWQVKRETNGTIVADSSHFPSGMAALASDVHSLGLKLGVYSDRGTATCAGRPSSQGYETQDANTYAAWGVDYLKYDNCNVGQDQRTQYVKMRDALRASGRDIVFSICAWGFASWMPSAGELWRTAGDINDSWGSVSGIIDTNAGLASNAAPGHWNDPDMLGNGGMTSAEYRAHFSMWSIMAAPLISGNALRSMSDDTRAILTAREVVIQRHLPDPHPA